MKTRRNLLTTVGTLVLASFRPAVAAPAPMNQTPPPPPTQQSLPPVDPPLTAQDTVPPRPAQLTPGAPGDFDFLAGHWRIRHFWRPSIDATWISFEGEASCWTLLAGVASVEELRIPARDFSGMGLRLLDVERRRWVDHWVNAKSGVLAREGTAGSFEGGVGIFIGDDVDNGTPIVAGGLWDRITPTSCRWRQVVSRDGGRTWHHTWVMHWQRV